jgi:hypothetical protein
VGVSENFTSLDENATSVEILDMRGGGPGSVSLNADDVLDFGGSTGESFNANVIDLVVRGDTGGSPDTLQLVGQGGHEYAQIGSTALPNPAYGGPGVTYDIYSDSNGTVIAVEDGVTVITN